MTTPSKSKRQRRHPPRERKEVGPEVEVLLGVLTKLIRAAGFTQRQIDARLGRPGGYVNQVLNRRRDLKVQDFLTILDLIEIDPVTFFGAFRGGRTEEDRRREEDRRITEDLVLHRRPGVAADDLEELIRASLQRALREELGGGGRGKAS